MSFLTERQKQRWTLSGGAQRISKLFAARGSSPGLFASTLYLFTEVASPIKMTLNPVGSCRRSFWTFAIPGCNSLRLHIASCGWPHRFWPLKRRDAAPEELTQAGPWGARRWAAGTDGELLVYLKGALARAAPASSQSMPGEGSGSSPLSLLLPRPPLLSRTSV